MADVFEYSEEQLKNFIKDIVWKEIIKTLEERLDGFYSDLDYVSSIDELRKIQGSISEIKYFIDLPDMMLTEIQERV